MNKVKERKLESGDFTYIGNNTYFAIHDFLEIIFLHEVIKNSEEEKPSYLNSSKLTLILGFHLGNNLYFSKLDFLGIIFLYKKYI